MAETLLSKKTIAKHGMSMRESASAPVSDFARRQMLKMGWVEGKGLGKNEDGMLSHLKASKREEAAGLGSETLKSEEIVAKEGWWFDAFSSNLKVFKKKMEADRGNGDEDDKKKDKKKKKKKNSKAKEGKGEKEDTEEDERKNVKDGKDEKKKKKKKDKEKSNGKRKRDDDAPDSDDALDRPSFEDLYKATGGARLGMRARADQKGKFSRTENL